MPTRQLSDQQRQRYANFAAPSPDQLARYFHLDRSDRAITDGLRGDHNRLGFALMLGSARFIGVFPGADVEILGSVTAFLVGQLGLTKAPGLNGYFDLKNGQRFRHLALIREHSTRYRYERPSQATQEPYFRMGLLNSLMPVFCSAQPHRPASAAQAAEAAQSPPINREEREVWPCRLQHAKIGFVRRSKSGNDPEQERRQTLLETLAHNSRGRLSLAG